ncbi:LacI family DNA-binding transcriptional regulator [Promicromonospora citrea]|uniref:LacI family transcriptional regulator n=1 Tax=Promicromonospora citrea TaxID=43677 RepID=A0A8H9GIZ7_9MICO|nr:LacI family DNA-binding transcriptional regulator [Promicromonospora citrea]NNH51401.1 LacI family DNA-binding transcriptional regulator [Promicromonospora citrea]GGM23058.1 LacI family transcriptional regulator [Promicromonospora citrea]
MPDLSDVAAVAGVSKATASRALNGSGLVAAETAVRVVAAAARLGYVPNRAARELARGRTGIIAIVVPTLDNAFFTPIVAGAQARAEEAGLQLTVAVHALGSTGAAERLARQVDGFLLVAPRDSDTLVAATGSTKPSVLVDREIDGMTSVVADTATAFGTLTSRLAAEGHDRVVYVGGPAGSWQDRQRTAAVRDAADRAGAQLTVLGPLPATFAAGVEVTPAVLETGATAVVPYATSIGLGLLLALRSRGVEVPRDLVVSTEPAVIEALGIEHTPAVDVDGEELGRTAMDLLVQLLDGQDEAGRQVRLPVPVRG